MTTTETGARDVAELLTWSRELAQPAIREAVDSLPASMRHISGYHMGWWDERGRPITNGSGKSVRPALALLAAEAAGGTAEGALPAAVAVELVHDFSLLHDDVMDGDATRRHRPTAWRVFGVSQAILAGDALVSLAFARLAESGHPLAHEGARLLNATVLDLLDGQSADVGFEERADVTLSECMRMAGSKTGALISCACALGALYGGADARAIEHLRAFGAELGLAFQLADDLLGIWGDPAVTGKPVFSDLANRKKSLPVVAALTSATGEGVELAEIYRSEAVLSEAELARAAELVERAGGRDWCRESADGLLARAAGHLAEADLEPRAAAELTAMSTLMARRTL
ncbi:family 2 encapsulin nanocompartment cargo protein polyprenyl transferase [Herbidospora sp. RD11066]